MRLRNFTICNMGTVKGTVTVDVDGLPGKLTAIWGPNGSGKTTVIELATQGALYRDTASRGSIADLATSRTSFVQSQFCGAHGLEFVVRQSYDAERRKAASLLLGLDGRPLRDAHGRDYLVGTGVDEYDAWARVHLAAPAVTLASTILAQEPSRKLGGKGAQGLLTMSAPDRRDVVLRALGAEVLDRRAELARDRAKEARAALDRLAERIAEETRREASVEDAEAALDDAKQAARDAMDAATRAQEALASAQQDAAAAQQQADAAREAVTVRADLEAALSTTNTAIADLERRAENNRKILADAVKIRTGAARCKELEGVLVTLRRELAALAEERSAAAMIEMSATKDLEAARKARQVAQQASRDAAARLADSDAVERAVDALPAAYDTMASAVAAHEAAIKDLAARQQRHLTRVETRIGGLREGLDLIANLQCEACEPHEQAAGTLADDDKQVADAAGAPGLLDAARKALTVLEAARSRAQKEYDALERIANRGPELAKAAEQDHAARAVVVAAEQEVLRAIAALEVAKEEPARVGVLHATTAAAEANAATEYARLEPILRWVAPLEAAAARIAEIDPQIDAARAEAERMATALRELPVNAPLGDVNAARQAVTTNNALAHRAGLFVQSAQTQAAIAEATLGRAVESRARVQAWQVEQTTVQEQVSDWTLLAEGVREVQADLADSAGPELAEIANELMRTCLGTRWTVSVRTLRAGGKGQAIEGYDLRIVDANTGREADAATYSPGERALIGAACADAVALVACRRNGLVGVGVTLVRDECDAPLSADMAMAWVEMTRRTTESTRAGRTFIITHNPAVRDACDSVLVVADGVVTVAEPGSRLFS